MIDGNSTLEIIKAKFGNLNRPLKIPNQIGHSFMARMTEQGIIVDELGNQSLLAWIVFEETANFLVRNGGHARKGDAIRYKLDDAGLSLQSIEGHLAQSIYGKEVGDSVFRRITLITAILVWAGLCYECSGDLMLR